MPGLSSQDIAPPRWRRVRRFDVVTRTSRLPNASVERDAQRRVNIRLSNEMVTALNERHIAMAFEPVIRIRAVEHLILRGGCKRKPLSIQPMSAS